MNTKVFKTMLEHCEPNDAEQLHDILTMMAEEVDKQAAQIKKLNSRLNRVNSVVPSTATPRKSKRS